MMDAVLPLGDVDLALVLAPFRMLPGDPTVRLSSGAFERATVTPEGFGTIAVMWNPDRPEARVRTAGPGGDWLHRQAPAMLGLRDDVTGFAPDAAPLATLWARFRRDRLGASGTLWHDLAFFIVQQRVARADAASSWSRFIRTFGKPAPGGVDLVLPPEPATIAPLTYDRLHACGIERQRAENLIAAARWASLPQGRVTLDHDQSLSALSAVRGIGPWTRSCLSTFTWGSPDTVITGDAGIPSMITWLLAREPRGSDLRMRELLEPYRPHRYRVIRLAFASGIRPPRRAPRSPQHPIMGR